MADLWLLVSGNHRADIEEARRRGLIPENMHFEFVGTPINYFQNRLAAR